MHPLHLVFARLNGISLSSSARSNTVEFQFTGGRLHIFSARCVLTQPSPLHLTPSPRPPRGPTSYLKPPPSLPNLSLNSYTLPPSLPLLNLLLKSYTLPIFRTNLSSLLQLVSTSQPHHLVLGLVHKTAGLSQELPHQLSLMLLSQ